MVLIIVSIVILIALLVVASKYGHEIWSKMLQNKTYKGEKKVAEADDRNYKIIFFLFGLTMSFSLCYLTFNLIFDHLIPDNSEKELVDKIEAELEEVPVIDLAPPPPPQQIIQPQVEEAEEEVIEEPEITMDTVTEEEVVIVVADVTMDEGPEPEAIDNTIYGFGQIGKNAEFPGGGNTAMRKFLGQNLKYPLYELQNEIGGTVYVTFVVEKNGAVSNVKVVRGVASAPALNKEALRLINSMPRWNPGETIDGIIVRQRLNIPIKFKVSE